MSKHKTLLEEHTHNPRHRESPQLIYKAKLTKHIRKYTLDARVSCPCKTAQHKKFMWWKCPKQTMK